MEFKLNKIRIEVNPFIWQFLKYNKTKKCIRNDLKFKY